MQAGLSTEKVIKIAVDLARVDGPESITLAKVAKIAGVKLPSLYNHIQNVEQLRAEVSAVAISELAEQIQRAAVGRAGAEALRAVANSYRNFLISEPQLHKATIPAVSSNSPQKLIDGAEKILNTVFTIFTTSGKNYDEAVHCTRVLRTSLQGWAVLESAGAFGLTQDSAESYELMIQILIDGLLKAKGD